VDCCNSQAIRKAPRGYPVLVESEPAPRLSENIAQHQKKAALAGAAFLAATKAVAQRHSTLVIS
jgi:hypothetical protein